ncbi:MAG: hypothetical protein KKA73_26190 [Chloroflexi bacterium]|nr:hypothetical protein [Chloroflexota bacterium]MBU1751190.1 hypothetical protein [Chloroflexota bacterium]MBU1879681.1 hypothetical protein [Chloroflexota bacterium]
MFQLVVIGILLWAGVGLVVSLLAVLMPLVVAFLVLGQPGLDSNVLTVLAVVGALHWLMAWVTVTACGGLFYTGNWLLYQGRRSVGPTVLLMAWTLFAVPSLILTPLTLGLLPAWPQVMVALLCLEATLLVLAVVLALGLRFYLHSAGVWGTLR